MESRAQVFETSLLHATALQNLLVARATGHDEDEAAYLRLRKAVLAIPGADPCIPEFVVTCGSLSQFWQFIKGEFKTYADRRQFIWDGFRPLLQFAEHKDGNRVGLRAATPHEYYSKRTGSNPLANGLSLEDVIGLYRRVHDQFVNEGYFTEAFGFKCSEEGFIAGKVADPTLEILLTIRKHDLWPLEAHAYEYSEDDFFDMIEFLHQHVSKPIRGTMHNGDFCGMHWHTFDMRTGRSEFRNRVNHVLDQYVERYQLSVKGEMLRMPEAGMEPILEAKLQTDDQPISERVAAAVLRYRRHGSGIDDRRQAVRDLADVLERLRPVVKARLTKADDKDLFEVANNFGVRHFNETQKTGYDAKVWLSWMFYFYLSTIHAVLHLSDREKQSADAQKSSGSAARTIEGSRR